MNDVKRRQGYHKYYLKSKANKSRNSDKFDKKSNLSVRVFKPQSVHSTKLQSVANSIRRSETHSKLSSKFLLDLSLIHI